MTKILALLTATVLALAAVPFTNAREMTNEVFYQALDPYGDWIQTADYGYVWHPRDVAESWRPYTDGSWAYTDAGWTWLSNEPYGAITYHYGRWTRVADTGWIWVPESEWAPAWVSWRRSDKVVGWAPLPPEARFQKDVGISQWADSYYDIGPNQYVFVNVRDLGAPTIVTVALPAQENVRVITETRNITNITYRNNYIVDEGPQYDVIVRESAQPIRRLRLERTEEIVSDGGPVHGESWKAQINGDSLRVFAPAIVYHENLAPARVSRRVDHVEVDRGWTNVAQAQELRTRIQRDTPRVPAQLPAQATFSRTASSAAAGDAQRNGRTERDAAATAATARDRNASGAAQPTAAAAENPGTPANADPRNRARGDATPGANRNRADAAAAAAAADPQAAQHERNNPAAATNTDAPGAGRDARNMRDEKNPATAADATHVAPGSRNRDPNGAGQPAAVTEDHPDAKAAQPGARDARNGASPAAHEPAADRKNHQDPATPDAANVNAAAAEPANRGDARKMREGARDAGHPGGETATPGAAPASRGDRADSQHPSAPAEGGQPTDANRHEKNANSKVENSAREDSHPEKVKKEGDRPEAEKHASVPAERPAHEAAAERPHAPEAGGGPEKAHAEAATAAKPAQPGAAAVKKGEKGDGKDKDKDKGQ